jgi:phosphoribosyl 1,2-cyclic phosphodiesterase
MIARGWFVNLYSRRGPGREYKDVVRVFVLGSGSSGNCLVVEAEGERLLVDAGMGPARAQARMRELGADLITSHAPLGVLVTHDHGDHAAHALPLARALRAPLIAHERAALEPARHRLEVRAYVPGRPLTLGPFVVEALPVPHDAPQVAVRVAAGPYRFAVATDLGHSTRDLRAFLGGCDLVLLESNYCGTLLENGPYPPHLKRRVGGPLGHLANEQAAELAAALENTRVTRLVLVHVSRTNNWPERAFEVVATRAPRLDLEVLPDGVSRRFDMMGGNVIRGTKRRAEQLAFGFG